MAVQLSSFLALFDEFGAVPSAKIEAYLSLAEGRTSESVFGNCYDEAVYYLTAHLIASGGGVGGSGGAIGGSVTSETVGSLSRGYSAPTVDARSGDQFYATTRYGQMYLNLRQSCVISPTVTNAKTPGFQDGQL